MRYWFFSGTLLVISFLSPAANAEFSEKWKAATAEAKAECDSFASTVVDNPAASGLRLIEREAPVWPRGAGFRPYACLWLKFNIDAEGKPSEVETVFRGPSNLAYMFVRSARAAVSDWRYELPPSHSDGMKNIHAGNTFEPIEGKTWQFQYRIMTPGL